MSLGALPLTLGASACLVFCAACGDESTDDALAAATPTPRGESAVPLATQAWSGLFALKALNVDEGTTECVGFHMGSGRLATAAHCLEAMDRKKPCKETLSILATKVNASKKGFDVLTDAPTCAKVELYRANGAGEFSDLAVVTLASTGLSALPRAITLRKEPRNGYFLVWIFGQQTPQAASLSQDYGNSISVDDERVEYNVFKETFRFSGTPLFAETEDEDARSPKESADVGALLQKGAVGMHVSSSGGRKHALSFTRMKALLAQRPSVTF